MVVQRPKYAGKIIELTCLGGCRWKHPPDKYIGWWECVKEIVKFRQQTLTLFSKEILTQLYQLMEIEDKSRLVLYSTINTPMDTFHGVDAFIIWWNDSCTQKEGRIVTLDLTLKRDKSDCRADVLISVWERMNIREVAGEIARHFVKNPPKIFYNGND